MTSLSLPSRSARPALLFGAILAFCLLAAWWALSQGLSGRFMFDDSWNLRDLESIQHAPTLNQALRYTLSGFSSALGRPLALATFAAQFYSWPWHAGDFVRVNILIHLLNGTLLCWCVLLLQRLACPDHRRPELLALLITAAWLWAPLQASAVLYVVQRMAVLSATSMLAGTTLYLQGRLRLQAGKSRAALAYMSAGLGIGVGLGTLAKENAMLLPLGLLAAEWTLLRAIPRGPAWRRWAWVFLGVPTAVVAGILLLQLPHLMERLPTRGFSSFERLLTESRVLFIYLYKLVLPNLYSIRLLYDDLLPSRGLLTPWTTLPSLVAWAALIGAAIRYRARAPVFSFGVLWYLSQHLLESTIIPLELAFEHRNYVASIGPLGAAAWYGIRLFESAHAGRVRPAVVSAAAAFLAFQWAALWQSSALWGHPVDLARYWARTQPDSLRGALQLSDSYIAYGDLGSAVSTLEHTMDRWPHDPTLPLELMEIGCYFPEGPVPPMSRLKDSIDHFDAQELSTINILDRLISDMEAGQCNRYAPSQIYEITSLLLNHPRFAWQRRNLYLALSRIAEVAGDRKQAMDDLDAALRIQPLVNVLEQAVFWSLQAGDVPRARRYLEQARAVQSPNPVKAWADHRAVARLAEVIDNYERQAATAPPEAVPAAAPVKP